MPFIKSRYPENWAEISKSIRERAGGKCEFCGAVNYHPNPVTGSKVILTVAHLNHDPMDCRPENLKALCQRCHLAYDREHHASNAALTRQKKRMKNQYEL